MREGQERRYLENKSKAVARPKAKRCTKCNQMKPLSEFYWRNVQLKTGPIKRISPRCKRCIRKEQRIHREKQKAAGVDLRALNRKYTQKYLAKPEAKRRAHERRREWAAAKRRAEGRPVRGSPEAQTPNGGDYLAVEPIARFLEREIEERKRQEQAAKVIAERTGVGQRRVYSILHRERETVALRVVDKLLTGLGCPHELHILYPLD